MVIESPPRHGDRDRSTTSSSLGSSGRSRRSTPHARGATGLLADGDPCVAPGNFDRPREPDAILPGLRSLRDHARIFGTRATIGSCIGKIIPSLGRRLAPPPDRFDERFGVDTEGYEPLTVDEVPPEAAASVELATPYQPTHELVLADVFEQLPRGFESATFVDLGCGRGRALVAAARLPFARIVGVELSERHADIARDNVARFVERHSDAVRCAAIDVVCGDASTFALPDGPLYLFAFNPFPSETLASIVEQAVRQASDRRRSITLATVNVEHHDTRVRALGFDALRHTRPLTRWWSWSLYRYPAIGGTRRRGVRKT